MSFSTTYANEYVLQDKQLRVQASNENTYLKELAVNTSNGSPDIAPEWTSLVTRSKGAEISRHLDVLGVNWNQDSLRSQGDKAGLVTSVMSQDGRLELRRQLNMVPGEPWFRFGLEFINHSSSPLVLEQKLGLQLGPGLGEYPVKGFGIADTLYSFVEPVSFSEGEGLQRFPFENELADKGYDVNSASWAGLQSRYFALLLIPEDASQSLGGVRIFSGSKSPDLPPRYLPKVTIELELGTLLPKSTIERKYIIYVGPKSKEALVNDDYDFSALLFPDLWQWMRSLSFTILWVLGIIHAVIPSWGLAIIVLAVCVRLLMYPLAQRALKSQQIFLRVQKAMQPELVAIKKNYKGGEQSERILQLYEQHNISPLAGLKPFLMVLIQIPIFVALFNVLGQVFELRAASFLWIDTLAEPDRLFSLGSTIPLLGSYFNLLPVLMAVSTLLMISMSSIPTSSDSENKNRKIWGQLLMAFAFFVLFYPFPAGMVLYWAMANILHLIQQWYVGLSANDREPCSS